MLLFDEIKKESYCSKCGSRFYGDYKTTPEDEFNSHVCFSVELERKMSSSPVGEKWDDGKLKFSLIPWRGVEAVGEVAMYGLRKGYKKDSWKFVEGGFERYRNALVRHLVKELIGEHVDPESGLPHLYHVAWNALAVCHFLMEGKIDEKE